MSRRTLDLPRGRCYSRPSVAVPHTPRFKVDSAPAGPPAWLALHEARLRAKAAEVQAELVRLGLKEAEDD